MTVPLSLLDLAPITEGQGVREAIAGSVALAQAAEEAGYRRVWYAEHHNFPTIASSATSVLIAHVATHTRTIRLGAGGVMLPNHSPLVIAEQFGTLASLHPDRIDLGLGRAPGTDQPTTRALRRDPAAADTFPQDVVELRAFLSDTSPIPGVEAIPGRGTHVPLYILGSSLFGAQLAAHLGLPYAFASHFAPAQLMPAIAAYREGFTPSAQLDAPYVIAALNVVAAEDSADAHRQFEEALRARVVAMLTRGRGGELTAEQVDAIMASPQAAGVVDMMRYTAVGTPDEVAEYLERFAGRTGADELIVAHQALSAEDRVTSVRLTGPRTSER